MSEPPNQPDFYRLDAKQALAQLSSHSGGLTAAEANQRLTKFGPNKLKELDREPVWHRYLRQYKDLMIILLLGSSTLSFTLLDDARTGTVLAVLVLFNTAIGFMQEFKAERIMESLERLVVPTAKVLRSGKLAEIASTAVVPGDVVYVEEGDSVPADLRLIDESELSTNDFALTGESNPSRKFTHAIAGEVELANRHNLLFMGTTVATGHGHGVAIATAMQTELGRIASLSQDTTADVSPLQRELNHTATRVTYGTVVLCLILLGIAIQANLGIKDAFLFAIGIASSLIPQGMPAEVNTSLAQAANKLARARALVKKLSAVETLGATTIICTDKTGTLTKNQMTVEQFLIGKTSYLVSGAGYEASGQILDHRRRPLSPAQIKDLEIFFASGAMASNAKVNPPDKDHAAWYCIGDPTEGALITLARKAGLDPAWLDHQYPEQKEFSFDSARKLMSSIRLWGDGRRHYVFVKGAPENVLQKSVDLWDHGHNRRLTDSDRQFLLNTNEKLAQNAMRNLGYAYKVLPAGTNLKKLDMATAESGLTWLGMVSMIDPLRTEVPAAIAAAHQAHIKISVVTGDYATTAKAISRKAGLQQAKQDIIVVEGKDLRLYDDQKVFDLASRGSVIFSRVSPEDKLRIVNLIKQSDQVVAVTGDGINDAPALKRADIGVAMGITGTDVSKQSAEIVLLDDSFHTLVSAIQAGRVIFQNIKKGMLSCFTSNGAELVVNLTSLAAFSLFKIPLALTVMQILAVDLVAELFPIAALGRDPADHELMTDQPRHLHDHILNRVNIMDLLWCGLVIGGLAYGNYLLFYRRLGIDPRGITAGSWIHMKATALTYLTIVLCQFGNIMQRRSVHGFFTAYQFRNLQLWLAFSVSLFCVVNIIYNPWIAPYFGAGALGWVDWLLAVCSAAIFIGLREFQRWAKSHHSPQALLALQQNLAKK